jgi:hypothetical protein
LWTLPSLVVFRYPIADSGFDPDWLIHCCMTWYVVDDGYHCVWL